MGQGGLVIRLLRAYAVRGCEELAARIRRQCRRWKRGPRPKTATVERREASVPRHGTRRASPARMVAPRKRDNRTSAPVGAPPAPLREGCEGIKDQPGRRHAPRERKSYAV